MYTQMARWLHVGHGPKVPVQHPCLTCTVLPVWFCFVDVVCSTCLIPKPFSVMKCWLSLLFG